ncbi:hypothetical protein N665_5873s0001 [Sinapis alba]|nr:hypothetical protein N665_5873s0001 [Sinapis alba]
MGKGRRLTISESERVISRPGDRHMDGETAVELELVEEDVWSVTDAHEPTEENSLHNKNAADVVSDGVWRTLKGRDMRRVRDAVWSQTGFDG